MENRLHHLNQIIDNEMSKTPVFTEKDEQNVLAAIKSTPPTRMANKKKTVVPKLLTAALFAGIIFTSYTVIDNYLTPDSATKEKKPETRYAEEFTQASSMITYDVETREMTITGTVKNGTEHSSKPFQAKVNILNDDIADDLGTKTLTLDVPSNSVLKPGQSYSFHKVVPLELDIVDENTFNDAIQVEIYSETKTLTSFVINNISYQNAPVNEPAESKDPADQQPPSEDTASSKPPEDDQKETVIENTKNPDSQDKLTELEEKYGKSQTPFTYIDVVNKDGKFFLKGATVGMNKEEHLKILGPYDESFKSNVNGQNSYMWNVESDKAEPAPYIVNYTMESDVSYQMDFHTREKDVIKWAGKLGEPYQTTDQVRYFYNKPSKQLLSIIYVKEDIYQVDLRIEEDPDRYIKKYTEDNNPR
jgi:hypothetical protein